MGLANRRINRLAENHDDYLGMGTTVVCALLSGRQLIVAHVGDSRLYRTTALLQLTRRSWAATVLGSANAGNAPKAIRHVLTNVLGARPDTLVHLLERELAGDETLLLCSDGLHGSVADETLRDILASDQELPAMAQLLISTALNVAAVTTSRHWSCAAPVMTMAMATDNATRRSLPERIGRYQVIERIGRGAMGVVYRARDEAMGREVALKVLSTDLEDDPDIRTRFHREAEAAARLSHPNIITIFDVGDDGDRLFIVMELLRGAILKDYLKQSDAPTLDASST